MTAILTQSIDVKNCNLSINGIDISANVVKVTFPSSWVNSDVTAFGSVGRRYSPGIDETKFTVEMMFNQVAVSGTHAVVGAVHYAQSTVPFAFYPATSVVGNTKISGNCSIPKYEITSQVGNIVKVTAECWVDNGLTGNTATTDYVFTPSYDGYLIKTNAVYATAQGAASADAVYDSWNDYYIGQATGFQINRSFFMFNTAGLSGKTITSASLKLNCNGTWAATNFNIVVTSGGSTYPHNPGVVGDYAISNYSGNGGSFSAVGVSPGYYFTIPLNSTGISWINLTGTTKLFVVSDRDVAVTTPTGLEMISVYTRNAGAGLMPQLVVSTL
jgi:hypothetical protein